MSEVCKQIDHWVRPLGLHMPAGASCPFSTTIAGAYRGQKILNIAFPMEMTKVPRIPQAKPITPYIPKLAPCTIPSKMVYTILYKVESVFTGPPGPVA